jgi:CIC family chloride channel protein
MSMDASSQLTMDSGPTRIRVAWNEHCLLFYAGLIGIVGGLGAQLFVSILNLAEHLFLIGIAGYRPPEPGSLNPEPVIGPWGLWLIPLATTLGGLVSVILVYTFAREAEGHGTDAAVEAFHFKGGEVKPIVRLIKT